MLLGESICKWNSKQPSLSQEHIKVNPQRVMFYCLRKQPWVSIPSSPSPPTSPPLFTLAENENYFSILHKMCRIYLIISVLLYISHESLLIVSQIFPKLFKNYHLSFPLSIWGDVRLGLGKKKKGLRFPERQVCLVWFSESSPLG